MPNVYSTITSADPAVVDQVGVAMELSAADPQHLAMIDIYLTDMDPPPDAAILRIGRGTGAISRAVARYLPHATIIGVDPSARLFNKATDLAADIAAIPFEVADGIELPFSSSSFDVAILASRALPRTVSPGRAGRGLPGTTNKRQARRLRR